MKELIPLMTILFASCGTDNPRLMNGNTDQVSLEQLESLSSIIQKDCGKLSGYEGRKIVMGRFVSRLDGEVFPGSKLIYSAAFGLKETGVTILNNEHNDNSPTPDYIICGEGFVVREELPDKAKTRRKYSFIIKIVEPNGTISWMCKYEVDNISDISRWK